MTDALIQPAKSVAPELTDIETNAGVISQPQTQTQAPVENPPDYEEASTMPLSAQRYVHH